MHAHPLDCRNCDTPLTGPYCAQCGQHAHESARSLHAVLHDAWHSLTHLDGKFWSTLGPLVARPGLLTVEYFADHRARYAPPFRLYLVVSLLFFGINSLASNFNVSTDVTTSAGTEHVRVESVNEGARDLLPDFATLQSDCKRWINTGYTRFDTRLRTLCIHQAADGGQGMLHEFAKLLPKMMFVFLPLMAAAMVPLYRSQHRFYVEHLVFLLHAQSAVFLALLVEALAGMASAPLPAGVVLVVMPVVGTALPVYCAWYIFTALRRFYGQRPGLTFAKCVAVCLVYLTLVGVSTAATLLVSALVT